MEMDLRIEEWVTCHEGDIAAVVMKVNQPSRVCLSSCHQIDPEVQEKLLPAFTSHYAPVYTTGSGNCMYSMLSLALFGTE